ncbi:MAG TPA: glycosyltransferase [Candidatus Binataceae bacterium]|nr:glycosyltransferase [Candidatus Binataceae bacterium]
METAVSVIIATYNRRAMVAEAIASVVAQREVCAELIVVDDGSTDATAETLARIAGEVRAGAGGVAMRIIAHREKRGVAAARNTGVALASAPIVAFLDSDDLWRPFKLRRQIDFMATHPECAIAQTAELWMRDGVQVNPGMRHRKRAGDIFLESLRTCILSPSAVILRTSLFRALGGFDEGLEAAEDYDLWLRILVRHEAGLIDEPLVIRRAGHAGQLSASVPAIDRFRILSLLKLLAHSDDLSLEQRAAVCAVLAEKSRILAKGLSRRGNDDLAERIERLSVQAPNWIVGADPQLHHELATLRPLLTTTRRIEENRNDFHGF